MWSQLEAHKDEMSSAHMRQLFESDPSRAASFSLEACDIFMDYSKNIITAQTVAWPIAWLVLTALCSSDGDADAAG